MPPRALRLTEPDAADLTGEVLGAQFRDTGYAVTVRLDVDLGQGNLGQTLQVSTDTRLRPGERIGLQGLPERLRWFPAH